MFAGFHPLVGSGFGAIAPPRNDNASGRRIESGTVLDLIARLTQDVMSHEDAMEPVQDFFKKAELGHKIAIGGGAALVVGSFLPWVKATVPLFGTVTESGIDAGDGWFSLLLGAAVIALATVWRAQPLQWLYVAGGVALAFGLFEWIDISGDIDELGGGFGAVKVGIGVPIVVAGALAALVGAEVLRRSGAPVQGDGRVGL